MKGRIEGLGGEFKPEDMEGFRTGQRLKQAIKDSSWPIFRLGLALYCDFMALDPDAIIEERKVTLKQDDEETRRRHEESYSKFIEYLGSLRSTRNTRKKLSSNTVGSRLTAVRSFYDNNYYPLIKPKKFQTRNERNLHVPTPEELGRMVDSMEKPVHKAATLAEAQSGIGAGDLLSITWASESDAWGTVRDQISKGGIEVSKGRIADLVHVHLKREKTGVVFDSFFGKATVAVLKSEDYPKSDSRVFPLSARTFEDVVSKAAKRVGIPGAVSTHQLRKFFSTRLKLSRINDPAWEPDLIEYWMGHSLGKTRSAYLVGPPNDQALLYLQAEPRITPVWPS